MSAPQSTKDALLQWSKDFDPIDASIASKLRSLAAALDGGAKTQVWAHCDLFRILNPERLAQVIVGERPTMLWIGWLELLRNVLVLLPLVITWVGIAVALPSYYTMINVDPSASTQSFVYLWQGGFGGRTGLTLEVLAWADALVLIVVVVLTLIISFGAAARRTMQADQLSSTAANFENVLGAADLTLAAYRESPLHADLSRLETWTAKMETLGVGMVDSLERERLRIQEQFDTMEKLIQDRRQQIDDLASFASTLAKGSSQIKKAAVDLQRAHDGISVSAVALGTALTFAGERTGQLIAEIQGVGHQLAEICDQIGAVATNHLQSTAALGDLAERQQDITFYLEDSLVQFKDSAFASNQTADQLITVSGQLVASQQELVNTITTEREGQAELAQQVVGAYRSTEDALAGLQRTVDTLHASAASLSTIDDRLTQILAKLQSSHEHAATSQADTAQRFAHTSARIDEIVATFSTAVQLLAPTTAQLQATAQALDETLQVVAGTRRQKRFWNLLR
jgi:hypothetical protein